jgi:hypothetical protein
MVQGVGVMVGVELGPGVLLGPTVEVRVGDAPTCTVAVLLGVTPGGVVAVRVADGGVVDVLLGVTSGGVVAVRVADGCIVGVRVTVAEAQGTPPTSWDTCTRS